LGAFMPFCRTHSALDTRDQEPWAFGPETERIARKYLELRYRLLPYTYTLFWEASQTGAPIMRPLAYAYPDDPIVYEISDQFLWGDAFLVAPIYQENMTHRAVYLPAGRWIDYWTKEVHTGPAWIVAEAPLDTLPLYVRAGSIIPIGPVMQYTDEKPLDPLTLEIYGGDAGHFVLYEDDGLTMAYREGMWATTKFIYKEGDGEVVLTVGERQGRYRPAPRRIVVRFHGWSTTPTSVMLDGRPVDATFDPATKVVSVSWQDDGRPHQLMIRS